jgi:hypothetical protein
LPDNVGVQLFRHRQHIWSAEARRNVYAAIDQWLALKPKTLSFWDYYDFDCWGGRRWLGGFAVTTRFIAEDIQWLKQRSLRTETRLLGEVIFTDGRVKPWHAQRLWWLAPDLYVTAKCLWNPDLELAPLMRDFYANCFGPAAGPVEKLYRRAEQVWVEGDHGGRNFYCAPDTQPLSKWRQASFINANPWRCLFTPPVLDELSGYLGEAKALAAQPPYRGRVAIIESGLELARQQAAQMK